jgi:predicted metalloprotease
MRWDRSHDSSDVEDRRGAGGGIGGIGLGGMGLLLPLFGRFGWRGILLLVIVLAFLRLGGDCGMCASEDVGPDRIGPGGSRGVSSERGSAPADELARFVGFVLDDTQDHWRREFEREGKEYRGGRLVLFDESVASQCGGASAAVGPFYCPLDHRVYIDLSFYRLLQSRFGAPGDFAQAYVIAHEVGHHVQNLFGSLEQSHADREASIQTELQADCLAGVWAHDAAARDLLEPGDLEEGMRAAAAVGDDAIQRQAQGRVRPESWTHGSSQQRQAALRRGYEGGHLASCGL